MPDTYTTGKLGLIEPARGSYVDSWDEPLYANWQTLDAAVSGTTTINLSNSNIVLTVPTYPTNTNPPSITTSCQNLRLLLQGALLANLTIFIPATVGGFWIVDDITTGSYTVTVKTTAVGSTGVTSVQGKASIIYSDGTNVKLADSGILDPQYLVPTGGIIQYAGNIAIPTGFLNCDGSAVSRTTYSALFAAIGTTWGIGDGVTTFNLPQLQNMFVRGAGGLTPAGYYESSSFASHTHGVTDPGHTHVTYSGYGTGAIQYPTNEQGDGNQPIFSYSVNSAVTGISIQATGGTENRPENYRLWFMIKT